MRRFVSLLSALALAAAGVVGLSPTPALASGPGWYYAGAAETGISVSGLNAKMRVSNPYVACNLAEHSIMEIALQDHPGGSPDNAVELGWQKSCGDTGPKPFAGYWVGGVPTTCYSACTGWHDNASNPIDLGSYITTDANACVGTSTACVKLFQIEYRASTVCGSTSSGTFFSYAGTDLGCLDATALPSTTYDVSQEYGEVYYGGSGVPCTDMGNGKFANSGPYSSLSPAVIQSVTYLGTATTPNLTFQTSIPGYDPNAYTIVGNGSTGNRTFSVGGPGYNSTGGLPGNNGSC